MAVFNFVLLIFLSDVQWTVSQTRIQSTWYFKKKIDTFFKDGNLKKKFVK